MSISEKKLQKVLEEEGMSVEEILEESLFGDSAGVPGICMNPDCDAIYQYEPDCTKGWCQACCTNSVVSVLILAGVM